MTAPSSTRDLRPNVWCQLVVDGADHLRVQVITGDPARGGTRAVWGVTIRSTDGAVRATSIQGPPVVTCIDADSLGDLLVHLMSERPS